MVRRKQRMLGSVGVVRRALPLVLLVTSCATAGPPPASLPLRQVVLSRNALGYFEHSGRLTERGEADRDHDRIPDSRDACPDEPETYNGYQDSDGCPDHGNELMPRGPLQILDRIYFAFRRRAPKSEAAPLLDAIAATIKGNPQLTLVGLDGYAADDEPNPMGLATARATTVRSALIRRGVPSGRLRAHGHGAARALCTTRNEDCRRLNRRVQFAILERAEPPEPVTGNLGSERPASAPATVANAEKGVLPAPTRPEEVAGMVAVDGRTRHLDPSFAWRAR
jgi:outer membrane protein OmpA-like peptidoglycan-associated protein